MALTTTTSASDLSYDAQLVADAIVDALYANDHSRQFVRFASIAGFPSTKKDFPKTPTLAAAAVAETVDIAYTPFATSKVQISVGEVGIVLALTRLLRTSDIVDDDYYATEAGKAVADKRNSDVMSLSTGFSVSVGPASGSPLLETHIMEAIARLEGANMPGPFAAAITAAQKRDLVGDVGTIFSAATTTGESVRGTLNDLPGIKPDGMLGNLYGLPFYVTEAVPTVAAGADVTGMMVSRNRALGLVEKWAAGIEFETDASARVKEVVVTTAYGVGEIDDTAGIGITSDAGP